jgi:ABC-type oligopeptide transport system substrate-binding subunit
MPNLLRAALLMTGLLVLAACVATPDEENPGTEANGKATPPTVEPAQSSEENHMPTLDTQVPEKTETATFALG